MTTGDVEGEEDVEDVDEALSVIFSSSSFSSLSAVMEMVGGERALLRLLRFFLRGGGGGGKPGGGGSCVRFGIVRSELRSPNKGLLSVV